MLGKSIKNRYPKTWTSRAVQSMDFQAVTREPSVWEILIWILILWLDMYVTVKWVQDVLIPLSWDLLPSAAGNYIYIFAYSV